MMDALKSHPRLKGIGHDGAIWSYKILPARLAAGAAGKPVPGLVRYFPARKFEFEDLVADSPMKWKGADGLLFSAAGQTVGIPLSLTALELPLAWQIRVRGTGVLTFANVVTVTNSPVRVEVAAPDWSWIKVGIPVGVGVAGVGGVVGWEAGSVELDAAILTAGEWEWPLPGASVELPARDFFHAGHTSGDGRSVTLRAKYESSSIVFYGPKLPVAIGDYQIELVFETPAPAGTVLGEFNIRWRGDEAGGWTPVVAGAAASCRFTQKENRPFMLAFNFQRAADMTIRKVVLTRMK
jgi:hypothetical protein